MVAHTQFIKAQVENFFTAVGQLKIFLKVQANGSLLQGFCPQVLRFFVVAMFLGLDRTHLIFKVFRAFGILSGYFSQFMLHAFENLLMTPHFGVKLTSLLFRQAHFPLVALQMPAAVVAVACSDKSLPGDEFRA